jgi:hypothetical protein
MHNFAIAASVGAVLALSTVSAFAGGNPNVPDNSPYSIGGYNDAKLAIGSGFNDAVLPGKVVGVVLTPVTAAMVLADRVAHGL